MLGRDCCAKLNAPVERPQLDKGNVDIALGFCFCKPKCDVLFLWRQPFRDRISIKSVGSASFYRNSLKRIPYLSALQDQVIFERLSGVYFHGLFKNGNSKTERNLGL